MVTVVRAEEEDVVVLVVEGGKEGEGGEFPMVVGWARENDLWFVDLASIERKRFFFK